MNKASIIFGDRDLSEENNFKCPSCGSKEERSFGDDAFGQWLKANNVKVCLNCSFAFTVELK